MLNTETKDYVTEVVGIRKPKQIKQKSKSNIIDLLFSGVKIEKQKEKTILDLFK